MGKEGVRVSKIRSRFIRKSAKPGAKRKPKSILMLGSKNIGKTCLAKRFVSGEFAENHVATVEERYAKDVLFKEYQLHIEIVDIDAFEFPAMRDLSVKEAKIIMLVYEVGSRKSLDILKKIYDAIKDVCDFPVPVVIVGTKADKLESKEMIEGDADSNVQEFVNELNASLHTNATKAIITSAKLGFNVTEAFDFILEEMVKTMNTASLTLSGNELSAPKREGCCTLI